MKILIYKRTHVGDPSANRQFGSAGCMGRVRAFPFDAIIGVGGIGGQPVQQNLAGRINWVGRNPKRLANPIDQRGPLVCFQQRDFMLFESHGPMLSELAPMLAKKVYGSGRQSRFLFKSLVPADVRSAQQLIWHILDSGKFDHLQILKQSVKECVAVCVSRRLRTKKICLPSPRAKSPNKTFPQGVSRCG